MLRFDDESRGGSGGLPDARCGGAAAQHPRLAGAATGGAGARRGRRPGFLAAEMAGEVGPTAWSRGSTSAIGCWRSRKGRDAAVDLRGGVGRLDSVSGRQLRRRGLDTGPRSDVQPLAGNEVEERKPPQRFLIRHHMLGQGRRSATVTCHI